MRNLKLLVEYDGTRYVGWQRQENGVSVQGSIESVLEQVLQEEVTLIGAGRTDAGVHARGQVANFRTGSQRTINEIQGALNAMLPGDIVVHQVSEVPLEFHARYDARERTYSYTITRKPTTLQRHMSWYLRYPLDVGLMKSASERIIGVHDFTSFCKSIADVDHYRCKVRSACWREEDPLLLFMISADRFLHGMVRALVGTMVDIGRGYTPLARFTEILHGKDRSLAGMAAPARGLILEEVLY